MDSLTRIIEQLQAAREELEISNAVAAARESARQRREQYEAHLALSAPVGTDRKTTRAKCDFAMRRECLRRGVESAEQHLNDLLFAPRVTLAQMAARRAAADAARAVAVVPMGGADETHPTERELSWQERMSRDVGVPLFGDRF